MRRCRRPVSLVFAATLLATRASYAGDPSAALDELKAGYELKKGGNCREALPHFTRSFELDAKPKALLNLADCEQRLGDLVVAQNHATQGRQLAQLQGDAELTGVADEQLAAIDKRLPRLAIRLAPGAPADSRVSRDGVLLELTSLGVLFGVNSGAHTIVVTAHGHAERRFDVTVAEGAHEQIGVEPGPTIAIGRATPAAVASEHDTSQASRFLVYGAIGVGAVGLTVGIATGLAAGSKHSELEGECQPNGDCPSSAQGDLDGFRSLKTWSTVGYVVGAAGLVGGAVLWLWLPKDRSYGPGPSARLWIGPESITLRGWF
jgi:hypothetical protein